MDGVIETWNSMPVLRDTPRADVHEHEREDLAVSVAWFPAGEYETAIDRWPSLAEDWADVAHGEYCARMDGNIKWMCGHGIPIRAVVPILVEEKSAAARRRLDRCTIRRYSRSS